MKLVALLVHPVAPPVKSSLVIMAALALPVPTKPVKATVKSSLRIDMFGPQRLVKVGRDGTPVSYWQITRHKMSIVKNIHLIRRLWTKLRFHLAVDCLMCKIFRQLNAIHWTFPHLLRRNSGGLIHTSGQTLQAPTALITGQQGGNSNRQPVCRHEHPLGF